MTKIIAIANHKGGVGKTTSTACLGLALSEMGKKVLLLDLDAQANLTSFFLPEEKADEDRVTIYNALKDEKTPLPVHKISERLHVIPSSLDMAFIELEISGKIAREYLLSRLLEPIKDDYDYILIDCPPSLGIVTTNAFVASTDIYIPLTPEALPLKGMRMLDDVIEGVRLLNKGVRVSGVFFTRYNNRNLNKAVADVVEQRYKDIIFNTRIRENISLAETPLQGGNIFEYAPGSKGAKDYTALAVEILKRNNNE